MKFKSFAVAVATTLVAIVPFKSQGDNQTHKTHAKHKELCEGFLPANTMKIPVGQKRLWSNASGGLTEAQFNAVIDRAVKIYEPEVTKAGGKLKVNRKWDDPTVNASAQQFGTEWIVNMYGGLARHATVTEEGFALVVCHELGHHIGGAPKYSGWMGDDWATNEGGADYWATLKCLRRYFAEDDNAKIVAEATIDPLAKQRCEENFTSDADRLICQRNSLAGDSVAGLFMDLRKETTRPSYSTPDPKVVTRMQDGHPATQCRMDTYFAGGVCKVDHSVPTSNTDYREGSCAAPNDAAGTRPLCWFKP